MNEEGSGFEIPPFKALWPFLATGGIWVILGVIASLVSDRSDLRSIVWFLGVWATCILDFVVTVQLLRQMLDGKSAAALTWGTAKLACLALIGVVLWAGQSAPTRALLMGMATLVVVPLFGGMWWYQKEQSDGERRR